MPIGRNMPDGTRVTEGSVRAGATQAFLPNEQPAGAYRVLWDDTTVSVVRIHLLQLEAGAVTVDAYDAALNLIVQRLGIVREENEGNWLNNNNQLVASVLVVGRPGYLNAGEEMHAHVNQGGGMRRAHVKSGTTQVRVVYDNGAIAGTATAQDQAWLANYGLRNNMRSSRQLYLDSRLPLPV
ncbi:MAG TPA: hypothetical protein VGC21_22800 [Telluria sp.]|jgi:hypothetical protein